MIHSFNYTNYLYRPRRPEELDTAKGGGILFNQVPHQIDTARLLGGGVVESVRAQHNGARSVAADRGELHGAPAIRQRRRGVARLQRLRPFRFRRMAFRHRRARRAEADRPWRRPSRAGRPRRDAGPHQEVRLRAAARANCRRTSRISASPSSPARGRHARLGRRRHDLRAATACANCRSRAASGMPGRREVLDDMRIAIRSGRSPLARWPLGQGHGGGRAGHPAIGARGPRGRAGTSGGGGRFQPNSDTENRKSRAFRRPVAWSTNDARYSPTGTARLRNGHQRQPGGRGPGEPDVLGPSQGVRLARDPGAREPRHLRQVLDLCRPRLGDRRIRATSAPATSPAGR